MKVGKGNDSNRMELVECICSNKIAQLQPTVAAKCFVKLDKTISEMFRVRRSFLFWLSIPFQTLTIDLFDLCAV